MARILRSGAWSVAHSVHVPYLLFFLEFAFYHSNCWRWNDVIFSFRGLKSKRKKEKYQTNQRNFLNNTFTADRQFIRSISFWSKRSAHTNNVRKECPVWIFAFGGLQRPTPFQFRERLSTRLQFLNATIDRIVNKWNFTWSYFTVDFCWLATFSILSPLHNKKLDQWHLSPSHWKTCCDFNATHSLFDSMAKRKNLFEWWFGVFFCLDLYDIF